MSDKIVQLFPDRQQPESPPLTTEQVAGQAVDILSMLISFRIDKGEPLSAKLLQWYLAYCETSLAMLVEHGTADAILAAQRDEIETVRRRLALAIS